ncbi:MAG: hypothetical protein ACXWMI_08035, partial [Syntrophales bacterium]
NHSTRRRHNNRDRNPERSSNNTHNHSTRRRHNNRDRNPERSSNNTHNRNIRRRHNNLNLGMETLKEGRKENRIEGRMTRSLSHHEKAAIYKICWVRQEKVFDVTNNLADRSLPKGDYHETLR